MWRTLPTAPRRAALGGCPLPAVCWAAARCGGGAPEVPAPAASAPTRPCKLKQGLKASSALRLESLDAPCCLQ
jgi:hypothetical protein